MERKIAVAKIISKQVDQIHVRCPLSAGESVQCKQRKEGRHVRFVEHLEEVGELGEYVAAAN